MTTTWTTRDLAATLRRRLWGVEPGTLADQVTADPERTLRRLAVLVADELRSTGQAVEVPAGPSLLDRLRPLTPNGERVLGAFAAVLAFLLFLASLVLVVKQVTS